MKKCIIISDSFKGTLSTFDIMDIFSSSIEKVFPGCEVLSFPIADGGEGTVDAFASILEGERVSVSTLDANQKPIQADYFIDKNQVAYLEAASCIYLAKTEIKDPRITTTIGIGHLIKDAINRGCKSIVLGLGGSSTNDLGLGILVGLGGKFFNKNNEEFLPTGGNLDEVESVDLQEVNRLLEGVKVTAMCDVDNPLIGKLGCSHVFAGQKGADEATRYLLDEKMTRCMEKLASLGYPDVSSTPGAGAAGGIGGCVSAFFHGKLEKGIEVLLKSIEFERYLKDVDVVFTGEGNVDVQTFHGKVIDGIASACKRNNVPVVVIAGGADPDSEEAVGGTIQSIVTTTRKPMAFEKLGPYCKEFYRVSVLNALRLIKLGESLAK